MTSHNIVYKFELNYGRTVLELPPIYHIRHIGHDGNDNLCVWIEANFKSPMHAPVSFDMFATGQDVVTDHEFLGTAISESGFVWHVYGDSGK